MKVYDAAVIGAGPAGSALAIRLSRAGRSVILTDKETPGRGRVCGGFLGPEIRPMLDALDVSYVLEAIQARPIREVLVSGPRTPTFSTPLPHGGGFAADRGAFDGALYEAAVASGAYGIAPAAMESAEFKDGLWQLTFLRGLTPMRATARILIFATGRRSVRKEVSDKRRVFYACKTVYQNVSGVEGRVILHFVTKGHVGLNPLMDGRTVLCLYAQEDHLRRAKGDLDHMMDAFMRENRHLGDALARAERVSEWSTCQAEPDGRRIFMENDAFYAGDSVTMVNPIVGGGIPIAMHASILLADEIDRGLRMNSPLREIASRYEAKWKDHFGKRVRFASYLGIAERSVLLSRLTFASMQSIQPLFSQLVMRTRPKKRQLPVSTV